MRYILIRYNVTGDVPGVRAWERPVRSFLQPLPAPAHGTMHLFRGNIYITFVTVLRIRPDPKLLSDLDPDPEWPGKLDLDP